MVNRIHALGLILAVLPLPAAAQEPETYRIQTRIEAPPAPDTAVLDDLARQASARSSVVYADQITGDLSAGQAVEDLRQAPTQAPREFTFGGGNVWIVIGLAVLVVLVWLRFGGAGNLLRARPKADSAPEPQQVPEAWAIQPEDLAIGPEAMIRRLLALPDRGQAAAALLRHALLAAAGETRIRLARADTERQAFDRLPKGWRQHPALHQLLQIAELAHYGGKPVDDPTLDRIAALARAVLLPFAVAQSRGNADA